jgi:MFS family permease
VRFSDDSLQKLGLLTSLYLAQGLPYGFFTTALPILMRKEGMSLALIGASSITAAPWALKFLWAPLVDKLKGSPLGARRGWILPLQLATVAITAMLAVSRDLVSGGSVLVLMAAAVVVMNLMAATQDIATDALAVDLLSEKERGLGNGVQVAAYRIGMVIGGSAIVALFDQTGWRTSFISMAGALAVATIPILLFSEPRHQRHGDKPASIGALVEFLGRESVPLWLVVIFVYKLGDALAGPMARTMLVDSGYSMTEIGVLFSTFGSTAGLIGAMLGGWAAQRVGRLRALVGAGLIHTALLAAYAWPAYAHAGREAIATLIVIEHLTGGMATVALFTAMMDICDPRTGGTDYTVQACVVVLAQFAGSGLSGVQAQAIGYGAHFLVVAGVSLVGVGVMAALFRRRPAAPS